MYCPSCGSETIVGLNYCNRCGMNLSPAPVAPVEVAPINLTKPILIFGAVILFLTLGGFAGIISGTIEMAQSGAANVSPAIPIFGMPTILTIDILLIRQLSKMISAAISPSRLQMKKTSPQIQNDPRLSRPTTARLEPAPSVTENTTRFLEETYRPPADPPASGDKRNS
jgi:hypothetical protein